MADMGMVEKVATALYYCDSTAERPDWTREPVVVRARYRCLARAAIDATFTDDLQEVIEDAVRDAYPASVGYLATVALEALKRAAHDAILKEEGNG